MTAGRAASRCKYHSRHWFSVYGAVGLRSPVCRRCGAPNPTFTEEQREEYAYAVSQGWARDVQPREAS